MFCREKLNKITENRYKRGCSSLARKRNMQRLYTLAHIDMEP